MKFLRSIMDRPAKLFQPGGKLHKLHPIYEALDTFLFTSGKVTRTGPHVRDALDLKRLMMTVVIALVPCTLMALYNTGFQANRVISAAMAQPVPGWRSAVMSALGLGYDPGSIISCVVYGALFFLPVYIVTVAVGGAWEVLFAVVRKHEINEGFLVTSLLFPLILPPTIPLWQVAVGISFGTVIGKEIFGGTGMNIWNPALVSRAFIWFSYPESFNKSTEFFAVDGYTSATWLLRMNDSGLDVVNEGLSFWDAFLGLIPGSMGETSTLACLLGAVFLITTGVGSWRTMLGVLAGTVAMATTFNLIGSETNPMFAVPFWWHFVMGSWAFGTVFMATDPVSSAYTNTGKFIYGGMIGVLIILVRVVNPAFAEGVMLSILFMNTFAPLIDHFVMRANIRRRRARYAV